MPNFTEYRVKKDDSLASLASELGIHDPRQLRRFHNNFCALEYLIKDDVVEGIALCVPSIHDVVKLNEETQVLLRDQEVYDEKIPISSLGKIFFRPKKIFGLLYNVEYDYRLSYKKKKRYHEGSHVVQIAYIDKVRKYYIMNIIYRDFNVLSSSHFDFDSYLIKYIKYVMPVHAYFTKFGEFKGVYNHLGVKSRSKLFFEQNPPSNKQEVLCKNWISGHLISNVSLGDFFTCFLSNRSLFYPHNISQYNQPKQEFSVPFDLTPPLLLNENVSFLVQSSYRSDYMNKYKLEIKQKGNLIHDNAIGKIEGNYLINLEKGMPEQIKTSQSIKSKKISLSSEIMIKKYSV